ncbi:MAG TPA: hypothetical protein PK629_08715 [Oscillospiraceae bacterium]|nr:hypothetical protein [Oscillospiraceae bacterium]HPF55714.1 hypothetical protein [Clostridiales bacterium]HPK35541.1 hypothetical protein [Oscillospiraceae bacterium]HPR75903.1 hypothetical protein [Oscillospiraceae bacterium]
MLKKKTKIIFIILLIIFVFLWAFPAQIRSALSLEKDTYISNDLKFIFYLQTGNHLYDEYSTFDYVDYSSETNTYYIELVNAWYANNDDAELNIIGTIYNYPKKPMIKVDGKVVDNVSYKISENRLIDDKNGNYCYTSFSFDYNDRILLNHVYEIYIRCYDKSKTINVVFVDDFNY